MGWNPFSKKEKTKEVADSKEKSKEVADSKEKSQISNESIEIKQAESQFSVSKQTNTGFAGIAAAYQGNSQSVQQSDSGGGLREIPTEYARGIVNVSGTAKRLVVPVDVQAFTVKFGENSHLPAGIHLHWAMPDGLLKGTEKDLPENMNTDEMGMDEMYDFPALPDLWVVVRQWKRYRSYSELQTALERVGNEMLEGVGNEIGDGPVLPAWCSKAWMIDSMAKTVIPLDAWSLNREAGSKLTAIQDGDPLTLDDQPIWTAKYDSSNGRFTFHDEPEFGVKGPLNYMVAGFYSDNSQDPIAMPADASRIEWFRRLNELGWTTFLNEILAEIGEEPDTFDGDNIQDLIMRR